MTNGEWTAGAALFSGRPDPVWPVDAGAAKELLELWHSSLAAETTAPSPPALGYRGCFLRDSLGCETRAFGGIVETERGGIRDARHDENRRFEKALLATAPNGRIPPDLLR